MSSCKMRDKNRSSRNEEMDILKALQLSLADVPSSSSDPNDDLQLAVALQMSEQLALDQDQQDLDLAKIQAETNLEEHEKDADRHTQLLRLYESSVHPIIRDDLFHNCLSGETMSFSYLLSGRQMTMQSLMNTFSFFTNSNFIKESRGEVYYAKLYHGTCKFFANKIMNEGFNFAHRTFFGDGIYFTNHMPHVTEYARQASQRFRDDHREAPLDDSSLAYITCIVCIVGHDLLEKFHVITPFNRTDRNKYNILQSHGGKSSCTLVSQNVDTVRNVNATELINVMKASKHDSFYMVITDHNLILPYEVKDL